MSHSANTPGRFNHPPGQDPTSGKMRATGVVVQDGFDQTIAERSANGLAGEQEAKDKSFGSEYLRQDYQQRALRDAAQLRDSVSNTLPFLNQNQQTAQNEAIDYAGNVQPFVRQTQQTNQFLLNDVLSPDSNPYLQAYAQKSLQPLERSLNENILPGIRSSATGVGQTGSSREALIEGGAIRDYQNQASNQLTNIYSQAYGQGLDAQGRALALAPQTAELGLLPSQIKSAIGDAEFNYEQQRRVEPYQRLSLYQNAIDGGSPAPFSGPQQQTQSGGIAGALGGASSLGGLAVALGASTPWGWAAAGLGAVLGFKR